MAEPEFTPEELETETWKLIPIYQGHYSVSTLGRVRREIKACGTQAGRILKHSFDGDGYAQVHPSVFGIARMVKVHILVAHTFLGSPPDGYEVNHIDGQKWNARLSNLEYLTTLQNHRHAARLGLKASGDRNGARLYPERQVRGEAQANSKLTTEQVRRIQWLLSQGVTGKEIAALIPISESTVSCIKRGRMWKHLTGFTSSQT